MRRTRNGLAWWSVLRERWDVLLVVAAGGALGSLARWALSSALRSPDGQVPWGTFTENVTGAFALAALMVWLLELWPSTRYVRPFLGVGVLGGYTTFSTYMLDTRSLLAAGEGARALSYLFGTLLVGLLAVVAGIAVGRLAVRLVVRPRRRRGDHARRGSVESRSGR